MKKTTQTPRYLNLYEESKAMVKRRVNRWPSAYASGQVVQVYKKRVAETYGPRAKPYVESVVEKKAPLKKWFAEKWIDIATGLPCGSVKSARYYPTCRPQRIAKRLTPTQKIDAIKRKQKAKKKTASYPAYFRGL